MSSLKGSIKDTVDRDSECESLYAGCDFVGEITTEPTKGDKTVLKVSNIRRIKEFVLKNLEVDNIPGYIDVACLGNGRIVFADYKNSRCCLCSSYYQHLSEFKLSSKPWSVCPMDTNEVAIVLPDENKIQLLRVDDSIQSSGFVTTTRACVAVVALGRNEFIFCDSGTKSDRNIYWGVIAKDGREKSCFHFSSGNMHSRTVYLALNSAKTQVYISCSATQSVLCFELNGKMKFEYKIENSCPKGIDLDSQDNVYVVLHESSSICLLSPNGQLQRTFNSHIPSFPIALSFKHSSNEFILTNGSETDRKICYVYQLA
ncbi:hypothetical protein CHS0354_022698 [Potamilus streckersoni]|uniref:Uncharacterized protein n=1 Tax=Potamilus streckersoni TaxID=2493646 RepID=A0AAE0SHY9_9BIVA|nr:hypothetical protein CHS0354_022698 [Potamilus streckersoni]